MLAGSLTEFSLPDVFTLLATTRKSGVLNLHGGDVAGRVWILAGQIAFAVADTTHSPLAARLLHGGEIEPADVEPLVHAQAAGDGVQMAAALAGVGVPLDRATTLLRDQVVDATFDLSRWPGGEFAFDASMEAGVPGATPTFAATDIMADVQVRLAEWDGIVATLPSPASVLRTVSRPPVTDGLIAVAPDQWEVLTLVDGVRTVADIIQLTGQGQFVVAKLLASLVGHGLVRLRDDEAGTRTVTELRATHLSRIEHEVLGAPLPADAADDPYGTTNPTYDDVIASGPAQRPAEPAPAPVPAPAPAAAPVAEDVPAEAPAAAATEPADALEPVGSALEPAGTEHADRVDAVDLDLLMAEAGQAADAGGDGAAGEARDGDQIDLDALLGGHGPDHRAGQPADEAEGSAGNPLDEDLLARLIDGVKGA
jgi:hypothetical protein